jgi:methylenetetrahydrofolate dehydrogenase (NADP+) / methenyltetrahydrofolate cyclohydrolase
MKIDGKEIAQNILKNLRGKIIKLGKQNIIPSIAIIIAGDDPSSVAYINQKKINAKLIGAKTIINNFSPDISTSILIKQIKEFNLDNNIHGIVVQQPLPKQINLKEIIGVIDPKKDIDGFLPDSHFQVPISMAVLKVLEKIYMATPGVEIRFLEWLKEKNIVVIGKGETGGKPLIQMFEKMKIPIVVIDTKTKNPQNITKNADIIISATGKANVIKSQMIKRGVVLIGIGISRGESAKLMGDYDQNEIKNIASFYTPTPGGVGPINVAMLLKNLVQSAENLNKIY